MTITEAVEAAHRAICEDSYEECQEWRGICVKAVEAAVPHIRAQIVGEMSGEYGMKLAIDPRPPKDLTP